MFTNEIVQNYLQEDISSIPLRINTYRQQAQQADMVIITLVCSDSRVVLPSQLLPFQMQDGREKNILFIGIPTIGGGLPSRSRIRDVIFQLYEWNVSPAHIHILVTQHGDTAEINASRQGEHTAQSVRLTCGLRKFFAMYKNELTAIRLLLLPWSDEYKRQTRNIRNAPDRLSLVELAEQCPDILLAARLLSEKTGEDGFRIPVRLILRAAYRNGSFDIEDNGESVRRGISEYLWHPEHEQLRVHCRVGLADYDHQKKNLTFLRKYAGLGFLDEEIKFPGLPTRADEFQDPEHAIISFGKEVIPLHNGILLPSIAGEQARADNVFRACASIPTYPTFLCALAEIAYAVVHRVHPHTGDMNFSSLKDIVIICDNNSYVSAIEEALETEEFHREYRSMLKQLNDGKLYVINLQRDSSQQQPQLHTYSL